MRPTVKDLDLFHRVLADVRPLFPDNTPDSNDIGPKDKAALADVKREIRQTAKTPPPEQPKTNLIPVALSEHGAGRVPGVDRRTALRLQRGKMEIDDRIDLHGMTKEQARAALTEFVTSRQRCGQRCLLVITGKGRRGAEGEGASWSGSGVLRRMVPRWLSQPPLDIVVLAYAPTQPAHGGSGALYVLLKRRRSR